MTSVAGLDGCRGGWIAVFVDLDSRRLEPRFCALLRDVLDAREKPSLVAVDVPIGLLSAAVPGGRQCDREARALLGRPRASSVFSPPVRSALQYQDNYNAALRANRASSPERAGISIQCHGLFRKIKEADLLLNTKPQSRFFEVHPELCFFKMNSFKPTSHSKKAKERRGTLERETLLKKTEFARHLTECLAKCPPGVKRDDILDALAACWTAARRARGQASCIPEKKVRDNKGLPMEMWF
jgi:predicted RNase H-like nuclease